MERSLKGPREEVLDFQTPGRGGTMILIKRKRIGNKKMNTLQVPLSSVIILYGAFAKNMQDKSEKRTETTS